MRKIKNLFIVVLIIVIVAFPIPIFSISEEIAPYEYYYEQLSIDEKMLYREMSKLYDDSTLGITSIAEFEDFDFVFIYDKDTALKVYRNMRHYPIGQVFPVAAANNNTCFVMSLNEKDKGTIKAVRVYTEGSHNIMGSVIVCTSLPIAKNVTDFFLSLKSVKRS